MNTFEQNVAMRMSGVIVYRSSNKAFCVDFCHDNDITEKIEEKI